MDDQLTTRSYNLPALQTYLANRPASYRTHPRLFEAECLYTQYLPPPSSTSGIHRSPMTKAHHVPEGQLVDVDSGSSRSTDEYKRRPGVVKRPGGLGRRREDSSTNGNGNDTDDDDWEEEDWVPDVFLFEYGTVVIWGMTEKEEKQFLRSL